MASKQPKSLRIVTTYVSLLMAFGAGSVLTGLVESTYSVIVGLVLLQFGALYGVVYAIYLASQLPHRQRENEIPTSNST